MVFLNDQFYRTCPPPLLQCCGHIKRLNAVPLYSCCKKELACVNILPGWSVMIDEGPQTFVIFHLMCLKFTELYAVTLSLMHAPSHCPTHSLKDPFGRS